MVKKYVNISVPYELVEEIDKIVSKSHLGYRGRSDLAKNAIRNFLQQLVKYEAMRNKKKDH
ncbi:hypothetical protein HZA97_00035 [Candidatus Woesearchaeota archaeon]|nr:hypothetical protein [Candidatus Woesearchaeota archaeon]